MQKMKKTSEENYVERLNLIIPFYIIVCRAVTGSSLKREVWGSNLGLVKSDTVLPTARHRCDISSKGAVLPGRNDAETGPANSLHAFCVLQRV